MADFLIAYFNTNREIIEYYKEIGRLQVVKAENDRTGSKFFFQAVRKYKERIIDQLISGQMGPHLPTFLFAGVDIENKRLLLNSEEGGDTALVLETAIGQVGTSNSFGTIDLGTFTAAMELKFGAMRGLGSFPLFSIVDHNCAHHFTYSLANLAFIKARSQIEGRRRIVINFDRHEDFSNRTPKIACDSWAKALMDTSKADIYILIITPSGDGSTPIAVKKGPGTVLDTITFSKSLTYNSFLGDIFAGNHFDAYITVDRDFMEKSFTVWGDGLFSPEGGRSCVAQTLEILGRNNVRLVGFDVTGLPQRDGHTRMRYTREEVLAQAKEDITFFYRLCRGYHQPVVPDHETLTAMALTMPR